MSPRERRIHDLRTLRKRIDAELTVLEGPLPAPRKRSRKETPECGTESGYQHHRHLGDFNCEPCRKAHAEHERVASARRRLEAS